MFQWRRRVGYICDIIYSLAPQVMGLDKRRRVFFFFFFYKISSNNFVIAHVYIYSPVVISTRSSMTVSNDVLYSDLTKRHGQLQYPNEEAKRAGGSSLPERTDVKIDSIKGPILVQLMDIVDISRSKYNQLQALEDDTIVPDPEEEVIATTANNNSNKSRRRIAQAAADEEEEGGNDTTTKNPNKATYKVVFQDKNEKLIYGIEVIRNTDFSSDTPLGSKWILYDTTLRRGVLMLKKNSLEYLGGEITELNQTRKERLIQRLRNEVD